MADSRVANLSLDSTPESRVVNRDGPDSPLFTYALGLIHDSVTHAAVDQRRRDDAFADLLDALKAMVASYDGIRDTLTSKVVLAKLARADAAIANAERVR